jgi:hypothetical protein
MLQSQELFYISRGQYYLDCALISGYLRLTTVPRQQNQSGYRRVTMKTGQKHQLGHPSFTKEPRQQLTEHNKSFHGNGK